MHKGASRPEGFREGTWSELAMAAWPSLPCLAAWCGGPAAGPVEPSRGRGWLTVLLQWPGLAGGLEVGLLRVWVRWEKVRRRELALESGKGGYPVTHVK